MQRLTTIAECDVVDDWDVEIVTVWLLDELRFDAAAELSVSGADVVLVVTTPAEGSIED